MKIAYVIDCLYSINGGTERQLLILIRGMIDRGHLVDLYIFRETEFTRNLDEFPCQIHCLRIDSIFSLSTLYKLLNFRRTIIDEKFAVVHGFFNDVALVLPPLMMFTGIKTYTSRRDMGIWYTRARLYFLRFFRFAKTTLICNSIAVAKFTQKKEWKNSKSIRVIYNGIERFSSNDTLVGNDWTPKQDDSFNVILVANVRPVKRIEDLIEAASRIVDHGHRLQYYVVGHIQKNVYMNFLHKLLLQYQLEKDFHFIGPVAEPRSVLNRFDIGVLTSASEGFSNTIMEYLDAGLPVIASNVGGNPELVTNGYNGFLYEAGDINALSECLKKLIDDTELRTLFAGKAKEAVLKFDNNNMINQHEMEYMHA